MNLELAEHGSDMKLSVKQGFCFFLAFYILLLMLKKGTVAFGSALRGWGFTVQTFAALYAAKFGVEKVLFFFTILLLLWCLFILCYFIIGTKCNKRENWQSGFGESTILILVRRSGVLQIFLLRENHLQGPSVNLYFDRSANSSKRVFRARLQISGVC